MGRGRRVLRILKWAGVVWCLTLAVAWPVTAWRAFGYGGDFGLIAVGSGSVSFHLDSGFPPVGFVQLKGFTPNWAGGFSFGVMSPPNIISVPIWFVLLISAALTYLLFRLDRKRIPPGHCQSCGYDLTGNVTGVCSECGEGVK